MPGLGEGLIPDEPGLQADAFSLIPAPQGKMGVPALRDSRPRWVGTAGLYLA